MPEAQFRINIDATKAKSGANEVTSALGSVKSAAGGVTHAIKGTGAELDSLAIRASGLKSALLGVAGVMGTGFALHDIRESIIEMLLAAAPKRPKPDGGFGITLGGKEEAWEYREAHRGLWERGGALDWLRAAWSAVGKGPRSRSRK